MDEVRKYVLKYGYDDLIREDYTTYKQLEAEALYYQKQGNFNEMHLANEKSWKYFFAMTYKVCKVMQRNKVSKRKATSKAITLLQNTIAVIEADL